MAYLLLFAKRFFISSEIRLWAAADIGFRRACFYQNLADAFERDQVEGLIDEETIGQLSGILYELDSQGRIRIEAKDKARARGVPSPDRADALMLAIAAADPCKYPEPDIFFADDDNDLRDAWVELCRKY